jgi:hypothetical protein
VAAGIWAKGLTDAGRVLVAMAGLDVLMRHIIRQRTPWKFAKYRAGYLLFRRKRLCLTGTMTATGKWFAD